MEGSYQNRRSSLEPHKSIIITLQILCPSSICTQRLQTSMLVRTATSPHQDRPRGAWKSWNLHILRAECHHASKGKEFSRLRQGGERGGQVPHAFREKNAPTLPTNRMPQEQKWPLTRHAREGQEKQQKPRKRPSTTNSSHGAEKLDLRNIHIPNTMRLILFPDLDRDRWRCCWGGLEGLLVGERKDGTKDCRRRGEGGGFLTGGKKMADNRSTLGSITLSTPAAPQPFGRISSAGSAGNAGPSQGDLEQFLDLPLLETLNRINAQVGGLQKQLAKVDDQVAAALDSQEEEGEQAQQSGGAFLTEVGISAKDRRASILASHVRYHKRTVTPTSSHILHRHSSFCSLPMLPSPLLSPKSGVHAMPCHALHSSPSTPSLRVYPDKLTKMPFPATSRCSQSPLS